MNLKIFGIAGMAALASVLGASQASANFITNGGFETGSFTSGWIVASVATSTTAKNAAGSLDFVYTSIGAPYTPADGTFFAMLGMNGTGATMTQTVATDTAGGLLLSYELATDGTTPAADTFSATWNGKAITGSALTNVSTTGYTDYQFWVTATGHNDKLVFTFQNTEGFWELDDVALNIPEPSSIALLGAGLLAAAGAYRFRRQTPTA